MTFTRRIQIDNGPWKELPGQYHDAQIVLGLGYGAAVQALDRGAYSVKLQILQDGLVLFELPYATEPHRKPMGSQNGMGAGKKLG